MMSISSNSCGCVSASILALFADKPAEPGTARARRLSSKGSTAEKATYWRSALMAERYLRASTQNWWTGREAGGRLESSGSCAAGRTRPAGGITSQL
jgi:hypothetical protein